MQERGFSANLLQEIELGGILLSRPFHLRTRPRLKLDSDFRSLNTRRVAQKISERDGLCDFVSRSWIVIHRFNAIAKAGKCLFDTRSCESGRLATRHEMALLANSPFTRTTGRFDVALELKNRDGLLCL